MKLRNLLLPFILISFFANPLQAQEVEREMVVLEIVTGTWCQFCPAAANGASELIENGHDVAVVKYHGGDSYETSSSGARINYYGATSYPTSKFDGVLTHTGGGGASSSNYSAYLPRYEERKAIPSAYTIDVTGSHSGLIDFEIQVDMEQVADDDNENIKLHAVITESDIEEYWQGMSHLHYVERTMVPSSNGTNVDFSENEEQTVNLEFSLEEDWVVENSELVVFLQNNSTKEILQGKKLNLTELPGANAVDMAVQELHNIPESNCNGLIAPIVEVTNYGSDEITSFTVDYEVNGNLHSHDWEGTLETLETAQVELPEVTFEVQETNTIAVTIVSPNNQDDEFTDNNSISETFSDATTTSTSLELLLRTDNNPEETTWEILNSENEVVFSGGPYEDANSWVEMYTDLALPSGGCYRFIIHDEAGNGFDDGNGMVKLVSSDEVEIVNINTVDFGYSDETQFNGTSGTSAEMTRNTADIKITPNPAVSGYFNIALSGNHGSAVEIEMYDSFGNRVEKQSANLNGSSSSNITINTASLSKGVYLVRVISNKQELVKRVVIQ
ncbi:MAG: Omp28-related outer membrane protein [Bacteroidota bacterium]